ncbi:hypothetical protein DPMN_157817 [Dreissena polymorpha]|uniref:Uncharacterized protein n=1 Tax=Dreissena polymorpha TaxID=45954 RepID=A0A9D4EI02_DREPO|nr:hypothetical protein DPMN_157817 [Dreissena polymorpha]
MRTEIPLRISRMRMLTLLFFAMPLTVAQGSLSAKIDGTFLIGAMFPIHNLHEGGTCGDVIPGGAVVCH